MQQIQKSSVADVDADGVEEMGGVGSAAERDERPGEGDAASAPREQLRLARGHLPPLARALGGPRGRAASPRRGREAALREPGRQAVPGGRRGRAEPHGGRLGEEVDRDALHPRVRGEDGAHPRRAAAAHHAADVEQHGGARCGGRVDGGGGRGGGLGRGAERGRWCAAGREVEALLGGAAARQPEALREERVRVGNWGAGGEEGADGGHGGGPEARGGAGAGTRAGRLGFCAVEEEEMVGGHGRRRVGAAMVVVGNGGVAVVKCSSRF